MDDVKKQNQIAQQQAALQQNSLAQQSAQQWLIYNSDQVTSEDLRNYVISMKDDYNYEPEKLIKPIVNEFKRALKFTILFSPVMCLILLWLI